MPKILLIEDDVTMLSLLTTLLEMEGYQVIKVAEEREQLIIDALHQDKPDLVLMDVHLRQLSGLEMLRKIKQDPELAPTRVLMSSGMDFKADCLKAGAADFIMKPYMPDDLLKHIQRVIQGA